VTPETVTDIVTGAYGQFSIVRYRAGASTPREYGETFYVIVNAAGGRVGRTFHYLRNARAAARRLARYGGAR